VDYLDDRIKSPDDIKTSLGVRCLGFAPAISRKNIGRGSVPLVGDGAPPEFSEALRTVRTNLLMRATSKGTTSLLVTSTGPGEGKTMVATNLAVALAQAGHRVLLVDADMRRCQVHKIFGQPLEPGLSAVLQHTISIGEALRALDIPGLSILTAGVAP